MARRQIGDYAVLREIERGDRHVCHAARGGSPHRYLLTLLDLDPDAAIELEDELLRAMELDHPGVLRPVETFGHAGKQVVVFEGPAGTSLERIGRYFEDTGERFAPGAALEIARQMFLGIAAAHDAVDAESGKPTPLVHAELGPHQIFVTWKSEVKVLGLGLSTAFRLAAVKHASAVEADPYTAPEVRRGGALTVRANVYSAAAILWSLLTGEVPPSGGRRPNPIGERCPDLSHDLALHIDDALVGTLLDRRVTCADLARAIEDSGLARPADLRRELARLQVAAFFDDTTLEPLSFPPSSLTGLKPPEQPQAVPLPKEALGETTAAVKRKLARLQDPRTTTQPSLPLPPAVRQAAASEPGDEPVPRPSGSGPGEPDASSKGRRTGTRPSMEAVREPTPSEVAVQVVVAEAEADDDEVDVALSSAGADGGGEPARRGSEPAAEESPPPPPHDEVAPQARRHGAASPPPPDEAAAPRRARAQSRIFGWAIAAAVVAGGAALAWLLW